MLALGMHARRAVKAVLPRRESPVRHEERPADESDDDEQDLEDEEPIDTGRKTANSAGDGFGGRATGTSMTSSAGSSEFRERCTVYLHFEVLKPRTHKVRDLEAPLSQFAAF